MYEHSHSKLAPRKVYRKRLLKSGLISLIIFTISLFVGIVGYHYTAGLGWVDSFLNASMILGGMGPVDLLQTKTSKIFAGCYSLFSGVAFLSGMAIFLAPILHRFLHKFHLDIEESSKR
ncbi:MAG: hypothetical protein IT280_08410 [Ignavibacteria bacterium]|nr:hypothetical protein [Ignavibacteria bacterium]